MAKKYLFLLWILLAVQIPQGLTMNPLSAFKGLMVRDSLVDSGVIKTKTLIIQSPHHADTTGVDTFFCKKKDTVSYLSRAEMKSLVGGSGGTSDSGWNGFVKGTNQSVRLISYDTGKTVILETLVGTTWSYAGFKWEIGNNLPSVPSSGNYRVSNVYVTTDSSLVVQYSTGTDIYTTIIRDTASHDTSGHGSLWAALGAKRDTSAHDTTGHGALNTAIGTKLTAVISSPVAEQIIKYDGSSWVNGNANPVSAGAGIELWGTQTISDISPYYNFSNTPISAAEEIFTTVVNNNEVLIAGIINPAGTSITTLDAGRWVLHGWGYASLIGARFIAKIYKRSAAGSETLLFSVNGNILGTTLGQEDKESVQPEYTLASTDRLLIKLYAQTDSTHDITVYYYDYGTDHYTFISTPLTTGHNFLKGVQGGKTGQYYHVDSACYYTLTRTDTTGVIINRVGTLGIVDSVAHAKTAVTATTAGTVTTNANLSGVITSAGNVTSVGTLTTAAVPDATNYRYCTDAQKTVIGNTSGTNTGDVTLATNNGLSLSSQILAMGTPSTLTATTTNAVTTTTHTHAITPSPSLVGVGTAQYQYLVTGASPYTPVWSSGLLNIPTGSSLILSGAYSQTFTAAAATAASWPTAGGTVYIPNNPLTTIGDIMYGTTTATPSVTGRLAAGARGTVICGNGAGVLPTYAAGRIVRNAYSTTSQTLTAATLTLIAGTQFNFTAGDLAIGTHFRWKISLTKTAAGTALSTFYVKFGTLGTTSDGTVLTFIKKAGTGVADTGHVDIDCIVRGPISSSCIAIGHFTLTHTLASTGFATTANCDVESISSTWTATTPTYVEVCATTGASDAYTIALVESEAYNLP